MNGSARARKLLEEVANEYARILGGKLVGIYEHGSLSFGCFNWNVSDIDFLVVTDTEPAPDEKLELIRILLDKEKEAPDKGFEMSVVLRKDLSPFVYPTPYQLHFSNAHAEACKKDLAEYCRRMNGFDRDLAAHCTVILEAGRKVMGADIGEVFGKVPRSAYLDSIWADVEEAESDAAENPVYVILNLCRVLAAAEEGLVLSKEGGGRWGAERMDGSRKKIIEEALRAYGTGDECRIESKEAKEFAGYMLGLIKEYKQTEF